MALVKLTDVPIKDSGPDFEKFDVEKNDKALIHIPGDLIVQEFVHVFHRDEPTMIERNGRKVPEWSRESFAGTFICLGEFEKVLASPSYGDPENCPACKAMNTNPRLVERPKRTFAMNVIRYATNKRSYDLRNNNVDVQVWRHADVRKLEPILMAAKSVDLKTVDFKIEADNSDWKKYIIQPNLGELTYKQNADLTSNMKNAYDNLFSTETLTDACGKKFTKDALEAEISRVASEFRLEAASAEADEALYAPSSNGSGNTIVTNNSNSMDISAKTTEDDLQPVSLNDIADIGSSIGSSLFDTN